MPISLPIHLIVQYYTCQTEERQTEIDTCLRNNLLNPNIASVHLLTEKKFALTSFPNLDKAVLTVIGERLTYERAFRYANEHPEPAIWILSNADIYFDDSLHHLQNAELDNTFFALARHNLQPDGTLKFMSEEYAHGSQDAWIFTTPVKIDDFASSFCLGVAGCDHRIGYELVRAGYLVLNPALKIILTHVDLANDVDIASRTNKYVSNMNEDGYKAGLAVPPPYQYFLYPTADLSIDKVELYRQNLGLHQQVHSLSCELQDFTVQCKQLAAQLEQTSQELSKQAEIANHRHEENEKLRFSNGALRLAIAKRNEELAIAQQDAAEKLKRIEALESSLSWRLTAPLRTVLDKVACSPKPVPSVPEVVPQNSYLKALLASQAVRPSQVKSRVDVMIRVHNGYEHLLSCISALVKNSFNCRVIVIDDGSTDGRVRDFLRTLCDDKIRKIEFVVLSNEQTAGWPAVINNASKLISGHFAILSPRVQVPPNWIARLFSPLSLDKKIGTVTALSNGAELCRFPSFSEIGTIDVDLTSEFIDACFSEIPSVPIDIPAGEPFCIAINREGFEKAGQLAEETSAGNTESLVRFCQRLSGMGFRNIAVPNLFVFGQPTTEDESSRTTAQQAHDIDYAPLEVSNISQLQELSRYMAFVIAARKKGEKRVLIVDFDLGGGSNLYSANLARQLRENGDTTVVFRYRYGLREYQVAFRDGEKEYEVSFSGPFANLFRGLISQLKINLIIVNQLVTWPETASTVNEITSAGVPYLILINDYFTICPIWTLFGHHRTYCGIPDDHSICQACLEQNAYIDVPVRQHLENNDVTEWRQHMSKFLEASQKVICFSETSMQIVKKVYPQLNNIIVNEHAVPSPHLFPWEIRAYDPKRSFTVAVLGDINIPKGRDIVKGILNSTRFEALSIRLVILGQMEMDADECLLHPGKLVLHGKYARHELAALLKHYGVSAVMVPSVWPETFCFTVSESLLLGYPAICLDLGAQAERVQQYDCGWIASSPHLEHILDIIEMLVSDPQAVEEKSRHTARYSPKSEEDHFAAIVEGTKIVSKTGAKTLAA